MFLCDKARQRLYKKQKRTAYNSVRRKSSLDKDDRGPHYIGDVPKQISRIQDDIERWPAIRKLSDQTFRLRTPHVIVLGEEPLGAMFGRVFQLGKIGPIRVGV